MIFAGRKNEAQRLTEALSYHAQKPDSNKKLVILGIEGPGGIGKSTLIDHAEEAISYKTQGALRIFIDGSQDIPALADLIRKIVHGAKLDARDRYFHDNAIFAETEKVLEDFNEVVKIEVEKIKGNEEQKKLVAKIAKLALSSGSSVLRQANDPTVKSMGMILSAIYAQITDDDIIRLQDEIPGNLDKLGLTRISERNAIRENARAVFSDALTKDLSTLLSGWKKEDWWKPRSPSIKSCNQLVMIIDDYERICLLADDFFPVYLLPKLLEAPFKSTFIIAGRDDLTATNPAWEHHLSKSLLKPSIDVGPLSYEQTEEIAKAEGVDPESFWRDTEGYPFYMQLWIDSHRKGGDNAITLKKFHERTTRWMSKEQISWLNYCLFLDNINMDSLAKITSSDTKAIEIFSWFEKEASIRSTSSKTYTVRSFLRKKLIEYLEVSQPSKAASLKEKAQEHGLMAAQ